MRDFVPFTAQTALKPYPVKDFSTGGENIRLTATITPRKQHVNSDSRHGIQS